MTDRFVKKEFGHYQLNGPLLSLLQNTVKSERGGRYPTGFVLVEDNRLVATDGGKMVVVIYQHSIPGGLYFVTTDGFMLEVKDDRTFPDYRDTMLGPGKGKSDLINLSNRPENVISALVVYLNREGIVFDVCSLIDTLLPAIGKEGCNVKTTSPENPFEVEFDIGDDIHVTYVQMPI